MYMCVTKATNTHIHTSAAAQVQRKIKREQIEKSIVLCSKLFFFSFFISSLLVCLKVKKIHVFINCASTPKNCKTLREKCERMCDTENLQKVKFVIKMKEKKIINILSGKSKWGNEAKRDLSQQERLSDWEECKTTRARN